MRAVLDTNIVLDLLHFADPQTQPLRQAIARGALRCFSDRHCLAELERVSAYPRLALAAGARLALLADYHRFVTRCDGDDAKDTPLPRCRDPDDQKFLALAVRCHADLLITRDRQLLRLAHRRLPLPCAIVDPTGAKQQLYLIKKPRNPGLF